VTGLILALRGLRWKEIASRRRGRPRPLRPGQARDSKWTCSRRTVGELAALAVGRADERCLCPEQVVTGHLRRRPKESRRPAKGAHDIPASGARCRSAGWAIGEIDGADTLYLRQMELGRCRTSFISSRSGDSRLHRGRPPALGDRRHWSNRPGPTHAPQRRARHAYSPGSRGRISSATIFLGGGSLAQTPPSLRPLRPSVSSCGLRLDLVKVNGGDTLEVGRVKIPSCHTPGHTPGSQCFLVDGRLISGDTLFIRRAADRPARSDRRRMYTSLPSLALFPTTPWSSPATTMAAPPPPRR